MVYREKRGYIICGFHTTDYYYVGQDNVLYLLTFKTDIFRI